MKKRWILALAGLVCGLYLATLRPGQGWMDDYAQYALHAANLAEGRPYKATGYIFNPAYPYTGPATYPPVFPLVLATVYRFAGPDLQAMKVVTVVFFSAMLCVLALLFSAALPGRLPLLPAGLLGLSPVFWKFKDYLYSEYVFMFFSFSALLAFAGARAAEASGENWWPKALAAGLLLYLAYGTRSAGVLTGLAFVAFDLLNWKKPSKTLLAACGAALGLSVLQNFTLHSDAVYVEQARSWFAETPFFTVLANNIRNYPGRFVQLFHNGYLEPPAWVLFGAAVLLAAAGFLARVKEKIALPEIYTAINLLFLLVCPAADGLRYGFPLVPFFFYYAFVGWRVLPAPGGTARYAGPGLLALLLISYGGAYSKAQYGWGREGTGKPETKQLFAYISGNTRPEDVFIFRKPRTLSLYTGRHAAMYHTGTDEGLLDWFRKTDARYLITGSIFPEDKAFLIPFARRNKKRLSEVYSNSDFTVYRVN